MERADAEAMDRADPLAPYRSQFTDDRPGPIYLDGNSLGRPSASVIEAVSAALADWSENLVGGWSRWIDLPAAVGDRIGRLIGAGPGQVMVCDSTTVNLYKLAAAALAARPGRRVILADADDFPTDRYVLAGLAEATGRELLLLHGGAVDGLDTEAVGRAVDIDTALVCLSHVNFRSGARLDLAAVTRRPIAAAQLVLWDLCHSAGAVPVGLDEAGADLAVGCTYKYLNGGPGSPAFAYVRRGLQATLRQPVWGWFGQRDQFAMGPTYDPQAGMARFLAGTPPVLGLLAVDAAAQRWSRPGSPRSGRSRSGSRPCWSTWCAPGSSRSAPPWPARPIRLGGGPTCPSPTPGPGRGAPRWSTAGWSLPTSVPPTSSGSARRRFTPDSSTCSTPSRGWPRPSRPAWGT